MIQPEVKIRFSIRTGKRQVILYHPCYIKKLSPFIGVLVGYLLYIAIFISPAYLHHTSVKGGAPSTNCRWVIYWISKLVNNITRAKSPLPYFISPIQPLKSGTGLETESRFITCFISFFCCDDDNAVGSLRPVKCSAVCAF